jgi:hypothetical protein
MISDRILANKGPGSGLKWTGGLCRQKGVEHALDHRCDSRNYVVAGITEWLYDGWSHSYPAGHRHHHGTGPGHSGKKTLVAI